MFAVGKLCRVENDRSDREEKECPPIPVVFNIPTDKPQPDKDDGETKYAPVDD